jgi:hypothetical protein
MEVEQCGGLSSERARLLNVQRHSALLQEKSDGDQAKTNVTNQDRRVSISHFPPATDDDWSKYEKLHAGTFYLPA